MKEYLKRYFIVFLLFLGGLSASAQNKPNVILILVDDMGWTDLTCYGSAFYETPNIDKLAASGIKFDNAYSACTVCSPSRAALMTGKSPARLHLTDWIKGHQMPYAKLLPPSWTMYLPLTETTIAEVMKKSGYATASIGKWHLGDDEKYYPEHQGFDLNVAGTFRGSPPTYFSPYNISRLKNQKEGEYLTDRLTDEALKFINKKKDVPFFLYLPYYAVHQPLEAKQADIDYFKAKRDTVKDQDNPVYAAMIKNLDQNVGRIMELLDSLKMEKNTLVIFTSDNGGLIGNVKKPNSQVTSNLPLRAGKGSAYEGGTRIPAIFSWEGKIKAGTVSSVPIISMDLFYTFSALSGEKPANASQPDGINLLPLLLKGQKPEPRDLYWHYPHYHNGGATPYSSIRSGDKKLIYFYEDGRKELYDLVKDPSEQHDLYASRTKEAEALFMKLKKWRQLSGAQDPVPNPDYSEEKKDLQKKKKEEGVKNPFDVNKEL